LSAYILKRTVMRQDTMTPASEYRMKAAHLRALARVEVRTPLGREYDRLARSYVRLAEQAERNSRTDVVYEPPFRDHFSE
jgi:hypothetical protein